MARPLRDQFRFLRELVANPKGVGAIAPSGPTLARAMATQIDPAQDGQILELGPGTGVVTQALIARGFAPQRIVAIEYDPHFAALVASRFAGVHVINGDAFALAKTLGAKFVEPFAAVVSSLPLLNFPMEQRVALLAAIFSRLRPGAPLVQFSYGMHSPAPPSREVGVTQAAFVWRNLPPARVWVYRHMTNRP